MGAFPDSGAGAGAFPDLGAGAFLDSGAGAAIKKLLKIFLFLFSIYFYY